MLRRFIRAFAFVSIFAAAATATASIAAADEPQFGEGCEGPAPEEGMVCTSFGDVWSWS